MINALVQFIGNRPAKRLAGIAVGIVGLLAGAGIVAPPAGAVTTTLVEHVCQAIGSDSYGNEAIVCTDLLSNDYGGGYTAQVRSEAYCQDVATDLVPCASITVSNETAYTTPSGTVASAVFTESCGHGSGGCPATRFYVTGFEVPTNLPACVAGAWGVTMGTSISLPTSHETVTLPGNFGTPHTSVGSC